MKYTKISSDKAYKLYMEGKGDILYFRGFTSPFDHIKIPLDFNYYNPPTRAWFRRAEMFIGKELPKVTVRQKIHCHINDNRKAFDEIHDMIVRENTGKGIAEFPLSHKFNEKIKTATWNAGVHSEKFILFDVDSEGNKSNFRFE